MFQIPSVCVVCETAPVVCAFGLCRGAGVRGRARAVKRDICLLAGAGGPPIPKNGALYSYH